MSAPYTNHLAGEKSPYLLQHLHNPVDWYPWGQEAFDLAKQLERPVFLSIGYATCHWCHVMAHESFDNLEIARMMNESFVNIKVDREEHPEIDDIYMEFAQALMASTGGWPLNVILTPDLKPFFAVTYLPPKTQKGMIGLDQFIVQIKQLWSGDERALVIEQANKIVEIFEKMAHPVGDQIPSEEIIDTAALQFFDAADPIYGGLQGAPKFPLNYQLLFLMEYAKRKEEGRALFIAELTLDKMAAGGIYDHLGGGFSRYTVDEKWQIPHFEKMLYDNALLAQTYVEGSLLFKKEKYALIAKEIVDYVLREMTAESGGFFSAEDADSEGSEGRFYTWTLNEIKDVLSPDIAELFCQFYGVTARGNFEGRTVLHYEVSLEEFALKLNLSEVECDKRLREARHLLFEKRKERTKPFKDDKILSGWNGLMIATLSNCAKAFNETRYSEAAVKSAQFIRNNLWKEGYLLRRFRDGEARFHATLDEYAYLMKGLLTLHENGHGEGWLEWIVEMATLLEKAFKVKDGAFYQTDGTEPIVLRKCGFFDGPIPSGNAIHTENLLRLYQITQDDRYLIQAEDVLKAVKTVLETYSLGCTYHLFNLLRYRNRSV